MRSTAPRASHKASHLWLPSNPGKRWTEVFFLIYSPFWITWALCILVPFKLFEAGIPRCACRLMASPCMPGHARLTSRRLHAAGAG